MGNNDSGFIPGSGRSPEEGNGNPFQDSCLGNPMDRGAWQLISTWGRKRVRHNSAAEQQQRCSLRMAVPASQGTPPPCPAAPTPVSTSASALLIGSPGPFVWIPHQEDVVHTHDGELPSHEEERSCVVCRDVDRPRDCHRA